MVMVFIFRNSQECCDAFFPAPTQLRQFLADHVLVQKLISHIAQGKERVRGVFVSSVEV